MIIQKLFMIQLKKHTHVSQLLLNGFELFLGPVAIEAVDGVRDALLGSPKPFRRATHQRNSSKTCGHGLQHAWLRFFKASRAEIPRDLDCTVLSSKKRRGSRLKSPVSTGKSAEHWQNTCISAHFDMFSPMFCSKRCSFGARSQLSKGRIPHLEAHLPVRGRTATETI